MKIDEDPREILERVAQKLRNEGHNPYVLHLAAVESPITTVAYVEGMRELLEQTAGVDMDWMVVATGGGSTQAGLMLGARLLRARTKVIGVNVGAFSRETLIRTIQMSYGGAAKLLGLGEQRVAPEDIVIFDDYIGQGYGVPTEGSLDALRLVARTESLILDPVYTSKAMAGLLDLVKRGYFGKEDNVCFLHTGGVPALFAYKEYFSPTSSSTDYSARKPKTHMCPGVDR
jgi:1-aminocyclopropane-1-carboxylate deaminase/D-cysteine desulfhydrase-like pyridoxal-dependent ACC family enzyme